MPAVRAVVLVATVGCGRIAFEPNVDAPVDLDLAGCIVPAELTFQRASPATFRDAMGVWRTAAIGEPRCAYDSTGEPLGVIVEGERTNFVWVARGDGTAVDGLPAGWASQHDPPVTVTSVVSDSPTFIGFREATITTANAAATGEYYQVMIDVGVPGPGTYTLSWFDRSSDPSGIEGCYLNAIMWTPGYTQNLGQTSVPVARPGAEWSRVMAVLDAPAGAGVIQPFWNCDVKPLAGYTVTIAAPQLEAGDQATSPILTTGAPETRAADRLLTATQTTGTIVADVNIPAESTEPRAAFAFDAYAVVYDQAVWHSAELALTGDALGAHRVGQAYDRDRSSLSVDGAVVSGSSAPSAGGAIAFGMALDGSTGLFGSFSRIRMWPFALASSSLALATK
jgi:hypothetical protein